MIQIWNIKYQILYKTGIYIDFGSRRRFRADGPAGSDFQGNTLSLRQELAPVFSTGAKIPGAVLHSVVHRNAEKVCAACQHCLLITRLVFAPGPRESLQGSVFGAGYAARTCLGEQQGVINPGRDLIPCSIIPACSADKRWCLIWDSEWGAACTKADGCGSSLPSTAPLCKAALGCGAHPSCNAIAFLRISATVSAKSRQQIVGFAGQRQYAQLLEFLLKSQEPLLHFKM